MANIPIWPGSSSFGDTANPTPFAFYDTDSDFIIDADRVADWCAKRLGYPLVDIELQQINFYSCFEEAITEYGTQVYTMRIIDTLADLVGSPTGSPLNNLYITEDYSVKRNTGTSYGGGSSQEARIYSASLNSLIITPIILRPLLYVLSYLLIYLLKHYLHKSNHHLLHLLL